ncbi:MAG: plastocyanin/azurin family copper-binding protein [Chloroflexota bacterium]
MQRLLTYSLISGALALALIACGGAATPAAQPTATVIAPTAMPIIAPTATASATPTIAPTRTSTAVPTNTPTAIPPTPTARPTVAPITAATAKVDIHVFQFAPQALNVKAGTAVVWTNMDDIQHSVTSGTPPTPSGLWDSDFFALGKSFAFTFNEPGQFAYFCKRHNSMTAVITVTAR